MREKISEWLRGRASRVEELQAALTAIPALAPENGGEGELAKAELIGSWLDSVGAVYERHDSPDPRVKSGIRPNIVATIPGETERSLWLFGHMDVVPPGDSAAWFSNPWQARRDGDYIYGRGVEDNQQAIVSMLLLAEAFAALKARPRFSLKLAFMADEERGSAHGLEFLLKTAPELFYPEDLYIVPDGGSPSGAAIEVAEKGQLWLKFTILGKQCHASTPQKGVNAFLAACDLALNIDKLNRLFNATNSLFDPPVSTFTPTKSEANVESVNILPGKDVFYVDCRLLPELAPARVLTEIERMAAETSVRYAAEIKTEIAQDNPASETSPDTPAVRRLSKAISEELGQRAFPVGVGGATVAAFLRRKGFAAAVWSCLENTCHQPNERSSITATLNDARVFANVALGGDE